MHHLGKVAAGVTWPIGSNPIVSAKLENILKKYRDILVAKGSALAEALEIKDDKERSKAAKKVYDETSERYNKLYPAEDRAWFERKHHETN